MLPRVTTPPHGVTHISPKTPNPQKNPTSPCVSAILWETLVSPRAVFVVLGNGFSLPATTLAAQPFLQGHVLEDELISFSLAVSPGSMDMITGTVQQRVVREDASGTLDFYWRVTEVNGGTLGSFRVGGFAATTFDADYRIDGLGDVGPTSLRHFAAGTGGATDDYSANFNFSDAADPLSSGKSSKFMFLHTDATHYAKTGFMDLAGTGTVTASATFAAFSPAPVPEPQTYALMLAGLGAVAMTARRRKTG
ncbi:hypothetical protein BH11PSE8_BH11PSE8_36730 [soil metagenome]